MNGHRTLLHSYLGGLPGAKGITWPMCIPKGQTHRELEWEPLSSGVEPVDPLCGNLGEEGNEESVISSMSEWEDADLGDFFFPKACLKELRNWTHETVSQAGAAPNTQALAEQRHADKRAINSPTCPPDQWQRFPTALLNQCGKGRRVIWCWQLRGLDLWGTCHAYSCFEARCPQQDRAWLSRRTAGGWGYTATQEECSDMGTDAEISHINGWVSLVSDINVGLAYLIDLPGKTQAKKMGKGKEKRQFLTEKASDRESLGLFRHNMANSKHHTQRRFPVGTGIFPSITGVFLHYERKGTALRGVPTIQVLPASLVEMTASDLPLILTPLSLKALTFFFWHVCVFSQQE